MEVADIKKLEELKKELYSLDSEIAKISEATRNETRNIIWRGFQKYFQEKGFKVDVKIGIEASIGDSRIILNTDTKNDWSFEIYVVIGSKETDYKIRAIRSKKVQTMRTHTYESREDRLKQDIRFLEQDINSAKSELEEWKKADMLFVLSSKDREIANKDLNILLALIVK
jgi:hypothetical protein